MAATLICRECPDKRGALEEAPVAMEEGGLKKCFFLADDVAIPERQMEPDVRLNDTSDSDSMPILGRRSAKMKGMGRQTQKSSENTLVCKIRQCVKTLRHACWEREEQVWRSTWPR